MNRLLIFFTIFLLYGCNKPKTVLICGDHVCINNEEAKQYFEDHLSLEVRVLNKKSLKEIDLVELNLKKENNGEKKISLSTKRNTNKKLKELSNKEIKEKKEQLKQRKIALKKVKNKKAIDNSKIKKTIKKKKKTNKVLLEKQKINVNKNQKTNICELLKECSIKEISKYLVNQGNKKDFPNITDRELTQ